METSYSEEGRLEVKGSGLGRSLLYVLLAEVSQHVFKQSSSTCIHRQDHKSDLFHSWEANKQKTNRQNNRWTNGMSLSKQQINRQTETVDKQTDKQASKQINRQTMFPEQMYYRVAQTITNHRQTEKQTDNQHMYQIREQQTGSVTTTYPVTHHPLTHMLGNYHLLTHPLTEHRSVTTTCSLSHSLTTHPPTHMLTHSPPTHSPIHWLTCSEYSEGLTVHSPIDSLSRQ